MESTNKSWRPVRKGSTEVKIGYNFGSRSLSFSEGVSEGKNNTGATTPDTDIRFNQPVLINEETSEKSESDCTETSQSKQDDDKTENHEIQDSADHSTSTETPKKSTDKKSDKKKRKSKSDKATQKKSNAGSPLSKSRKKSKRREARKKTNLQNSQAGGTRSSTGDSPTPLRQNVRKGKYRPTSQHLNHCRLLRCVTATDNFHGGNEGELSGVHIGDVIALRGVASEGWCEGELNGKVGWFPITIAKELSDEANQPATPDTPSTEVETIQEGVDQSSLIQNKRSILGMIERKLKKRPPITDLVEKNIVSGSDNLRSEQLLKNIEQQKTAVVLTNLLSGRRSGPPNEVNNLSEFSESGEARGSPFDDSEVSFAGEVSGSEEDTIEEQGLQLFETRPMKAVKMMIENKIIQGTPQAIADFLYCNPRLSGKMVGEYLGENEEINLEVLDAFLDKMNLTDTEFDQAMRKFLFVFFLPGEAQKIDRIMCAFAKKYYLQNSGTSRKHGKIFKSQDSVYLLAFATIMLNTDLHSMNVKTKMTQEQFVTRTNDGSFPDVFLRDLYQRIAEEEIRTKDDKFTHAAKRGYLFLEKRIGLRNRKKHVQYWFVLDPESKSLYAFKEKDEQKMVEQFELESLSIKKKQSPTADKSRRYPLQLLYAKQKPPELRLLARSQRLWIDWLTIFTEVLN